MAPGGVGIAVTDVRQVSPHEQVTMMVGTRTGGAYVGSKQERNKSLGSKGDFFRVGFLDGGSVRSAVQVPNTAVPLHSALLGDKGTTQIKSRSALNLSRVEFLS